MEIRSELEGDYSQIEKITKLAFEGKVYSSGTEEYLATKLRKANALTISLVATIDGVIVGHVAASKVYIDGKDVGCFGIGPLAVLPEMQKSGIGTKLLKSALSKLEEMGADCCVLVGDPTYYSRVGFIVCKNLSYSGAPAEYFQFINFTRTNLSGEVSFHSAFEE